jgi:hypothetical protein
MIVAGKSARTDLFRFYLESENRELLTVASLFSNKGFDKQ